MCDLTPLHCVLNWKVFFTLITTIRSSLLMFPLTPDQHHWLEVATEDEGMPSQEHHQRKVHDGHCSIVWLVKLVTTILQTLEKHVIMTNELNHFSKDMISGVKPKAKASPNAKTSDSISNLTGLSSLLPLPFPLPFSLLPFLSVSFPSPSLSPLHEVHPFAARRFGDLGERFSSPSRSGHSPPTKRFLVYFRLKFTPLLIITLTSCH